MTFQVQTGMYPACAHAEDMYEDIPASKLCTRGCKICAEGGMTLQARIEESRGCRR